MTNFFAPTSWKISNYSGCTEMRGYLQDRCKKKLSKGLEMKKLKEVHEIYTGK